MSSFDEQTEQAMVAHMNNDHVDAMRSYCRMRDIAVIAGEPEMLTIDFNGFDMRVDDKTYRFGFSQTCDTPEKVRAALVALAKLRG